MSVEIVPLAQSHFAGLREALDVVAREKRFLALTQAPPPEAADAFYRNIVENDLCQFVAVEDGVVVGWCDVLPRPGDARAHVGVLGIGLVPSARHRGVGRRLMQATIARAWARGLTRIELSVRVDNANARALYEDLGFVVEGLNRHALRIDGQYFDNYAMALLRPPGT